MIADRTLPGHLPVRVHYPANLDGPAPVIVFSHGLGGSRLGYGFLAQAWAERGYVVVLPSHRENVPKGVAEVEKPSVAELRAMKQAIEDPRNWPKRPLDIRRTVDALETLPEHVRALAGKLDLGRVGIGGHSYGAYTALLCAGARIRVGDGWESYAEPRAKAFLALSPPGNGSRGLLGQSWASIHAPLLCMTGTQDRGVLGEPALWREDAFRSLSGPSQGLVVVEGADHATFSGGRPRSPADPSHLRQIEAATSWFWDKHLRGVDAPFPVLPGARVEWK
ncbi:MAG TPA: alpha/beta fold hydrolase [Myxococcales bacterium]